MGSKKRMGKRTWQVREGGFTPDEARGSEAGMVGAGSSESGAGSGVAKRSQCHD